MNIVYPTKQQASDMITFLSAADCPTPGMCAKEFYESGATVYWSFSGEKTHVKRRKK